MTASNVPNLPFLKPWYRIARDADQLLFQSGDQVVTLQGRAAVSFIPVLLPLLDGTRTVEAIHSCIGENVRPATDQALSVLARHGLLTEGPPCDDSHELLGEAVRFHAAYARGVTPAEIAQRLRAARVGVVGGDAFAEACARELSLSGVGSVEAVGPLSSFRSTGQDLVVVAPGRGDGHLAREWNALALANGIPWMLAEPHDAHAPLVGPLVIPASTACYECYLLRRASNLDNPEAFRVLDREPSTSPVPHALLSLAASLVSMLATRWLSVKDHFVPGRVYAVGLGRTFSLTAHVVYRVPRCPACSPAARSGPPSPWFEATRPEDL